jgi:hypothetical protein
MGSNSSIVVDESTPDHLITQGNNSLAIYFHKTILSYKELRVFFAAKRMVARANLYLNSHWSMSMKTWTFSVSNPSPYPRSGYVTIDLDQLGVPRELDETSLILTRAGNHVKTSDAFIPFQIDYPLGLSELENSLHSRVLTFKTGEVCSGPDDYSKVGAEYQLKQSSSASNTCPFNTGVCFHNLCADDDNRDSYGCVWSDNPVKDKSIGVKLFNCDLDAYFRVAPLYVDQNSYVGGATSIMSKLAGWRFGNGEMLLPFENSNVTRWAQLYRIAFFPMPWQRQWFDEEQLIDDETPTDDKPYDIVWWSPGPVRAVAVLRSPPISVTYRGAPFFSGENRITCHLYRMICIYPSQLNIADHPFVHETLYVVTDDGMNSLSFRPYFRSFLSSRGSQPIINRLEHIPDYFALWKHFAYQGYGYAFASDTHIRGIEIEGSDFLWRLPYTHYNSCIHGFFSYATGDVGFDPINRIGHEGWYEQIFKPLRATDESIRFPPTLKRSP